MSQLVRQSQDELVCKMRREGKGMDGEGSQGEGNGSKGSGREGKGPGPLWGTPWKEPAGSDLSHPLRTRVCGPTLELWLLLPWWGVLKRGGKCG